MAMIYCNECGKEISDKADKCPHCGCPVLKIRKCKIKFKNQKKEKYLVLVLLHWYFQYWDVHFYWCNTCNY